MSNLRSFSSESSRAVSPTEVSNKLYAKGLEKMAHDKYVTSTKDLHKIDKRYTFRPMLNINSDKLAKKKRDPMMNSRNLTEYLYNERKQQPSRTQEFSQASPGNNDDSFTSQKSLTHQSVKVLERRIDKTIVKALSQIKFDQEKGLRVNDLFILMKFMRYVAHQDYEKVQKAFNMVAFDNEYLGYEEIKTIICGIEGLHLE